MAKNVLGGPLITCSEDPVTGFFRNGKCDTRADDQGMHTVCVLMTDDVSSFFPRVREWPLYSDTRIWIPRLGERGLLVSLPVPLDSGVRRRNGTAY